MLVAPVGFEPTKIHVLSVLRVPFRDGAIVGTRGGIRTHINWFLRPARLPFRHPRLAWGTEFNRPVLRLSATGSLVAAEGLEPSIVAL